MAPAVNGVKGQANGVHSSWQAKHEVGSHFIGGNKLEKAPPSKVKDFVQASDGHSVINSVCFRCRDWRAWNWLTLEFAGFDCQQWYCGRQRNPIGTKMGLRDFWRRACHSIHSDGHARRLAGKRRLHSNGGPVRRGMTAQQGVMGERARLTQIPGSRWHEQQ